jgi:hypothetical protein
MKLLAKKWPLLALLLALTGPVFAQTEEEPRRRSSDDDDQPPAPFWQRVRFGGNFGLQLGTNTFIDISPTAAYQVTERFQLGAGITYQYFRFRTFNPVTNQRGNAVGNSLYGGRGFARFFPVSTFFAQAEYEMLNSAFFNFNSGEIERGWVPSAFIGGGYFQNFGNGRSGFMATILYNVLWEQNRTRSPYGSPWVVRVGFQM